MKWPASAGSIGAIRGDRIEHPGLEGQRQCPELRFIPEIVASLSYDPWDTQLGSLGERVDD